MKIDLIEFCGDCSNYIYKGNTLFCSILDIPVDEAGKIPDECPLEEKDAIKYVRADRFEHIKECAESKHHTG